MLPWPSHCFLPHAQLLGLALGRRMWDVSANAAKPAHKRYWRGPSRCHEVLVPFLGPKIRPRNLIGLPPCILTRYQCTRNLQETRKPPTGDWQETFRKPSRNGKPMGRPGEADRKPTGNLQETRRKHAGKLQETCRKLTGIPWETCRKPARNLQEARR